ncbi:toprim domain-containing protein [Sphingobium sp. BHU LFT2]|nr:toprim domain-containing protein [Sphingobium sp. BHU LFT2]
MPPNILDLEFQGARLVRKLGGVWHGGQGLCLCPAHDDHDPSLSVRVGDTALLFKCFAGCDTIAVLRAIRRLRLDLPERGTPISSTRHRRFQTGSGPALRVWDASSPMTGTPAEAYLAGRFLMPPWRDLRYNPRTPLGRGRAAVFRPALIAAVREGHRIVAIHRTFLDPVAALKASDLTDPRMMLGRPGRGAVQLAPATTILGLAEGIETALAAMRLHRIPVWATLGAERAAHVLLPSRLERLVLLFDRDAAGWKANRQIRLAHQHTGLEVFSPWPPVPHNDWADVLEDMPRVACRSRQCGNRRAATSASALPSRTIHVACDPVSYRPGPAQQEGRERGWAVR